MEITYPYKMSINTKEEAKYTILHMCAECPDRLYHCSGDKALKCDEVKEQIRDTFADK